MKHPLDRVPEGRLKRVQLPSLLVAALTIGALPWILPGRESHTLLELVESGSAARAAEIVSHWSASDRIRVAHAVGLDYAMNPAYMNVLAVAAIWAGRRFRAGAGRAAGTVLAWLCWSVVVTNAVENVALFQALALVPRNPWPALAAGAHYWAGAVIVPTAIFCLAALVRRPAASHPAD